MSNSSTHIGGILQIQIEFHGVLRFSSISESDNTSESTVSFSSFVPLRSMIGFNTLSNGQKFPFDFNSSITFSIPILSSLSIATVMSIILSEAPINSAIPATFLLLSFIVTPNFKFSNTSLMMEINSISFSKEFDPITSASH